MLQPEALLGRPVVDNAGQNVGVVLDVGVGEQRSPKFLLVGRGKQVQRIEMRDVELRPDAVRVRLPN